MSLMERWRSAGERADRFAGRMVSRFCGFVAAAIAVAAAFASYSILTSGESLVAGIVFGAAALGCTWLARHCFRSQDRLSDMDI